MEYEVRATNYPNFLMAAGFYGDYGRDRAQKMIDEGYFHRHIMPEFKDAIFEVIPKNEKNKTEAEKLVDGLFGKNKAKKMFAEIVIEAMIKFKKP